MNYLYLELYKVGGDVYGQFIEWSHFKNLKAEHERCFTLRGEKLTQVFVVSNNTIRDQDATDFIDRYQKGRVVHHHIDLSQLGRFPEGKK